MRSPRRLQGRFHHSVKDVVQLQRGVQLFHCSLESYQLIKTSLQALVSPLIELGIVNHSGCLVGKDAEQPGIITAERNAICPICCLDHTEASPSYDHRGKDCIAEPSGTCQTPHPQFVDQRFVLHIIQDQRLLLLPELPSPASLRDRQLVALHNVRRNPEEWQLADEGLRTLIVEQDTAHLDMHQPCDPLADFSVDLSKI